MATNQIKLKFVSTDESDDFVKINLFIQQKGLDKHKIQIYDSKKRYFETIMSKEKIKYYLKQYQIKQLNIFYCKSKIGKLLIYLNFNDYCNQINPIEEIYYFDDNLVMIEREIMLTSDALKIYENMIMNPGIDITNRDLIKDKIHIYLYELENLIEKKKYVEKFYPLDNDLYIKHKSIKSTKSTKLNNFDSDPLEKLDEPNGSNKSDKSDKIIDSIKLVELVELVKPIKINKLKNSINLSEQTKLTKSNNFIGLNYFSKYIKCLKKKKCSIKCKTHVIESHYNCLFININKVKCLICGECWKCSECYQIIKANNYNDTIKCTECFQNILVCLKKN